MHRRHTDPVQLQAAGVSEQRVRGGVSREGEGSAWLLQVLAGAGWCWLVLAAPGCCFQTIELSPSSFSIFWLQGMGEVHPCDLGHMVLGPAQRWGTYLTYMRSQLPFPVPQ